MCEVRPAGCSPIAVPIHYNKVPFQGLWVCDHDVGGVVFAVIEDKELLRSMLQKQVQPCPPYHIASRLPPYQHVTA